MNSRHVSAGDILPIETERAEAEALVTVPSSEYVGEDGARVIARFDRSETKYREAIKGGKAVDK